MRSKQTEIGLEMALSQQEITWLKYVYCGSLYFGVISDGYGHERTGWERDYERFHVGATQPLHLTICSQKSAIKDQKLLLGLPVGYQAHPLHL